MSENNSDRLRGLNNPQTPEEPASLTSRSPNLSPSPPAQTRQASSSSAPAISAIDPPGQSRRPWVPIAVGFGLLGTLVIASLVTALVLRSPSPDISAPVERVGDIPSGEPIGQPPGDGDSLFDRPVDLAGLRDEVLSSTVTIWCAPDESFGSGFVFDLAPLIGESDVVVVTNHHVVAACIPDTQVEVMSGSQVLMGELDGWDIDTDIALISVPGLSASPLVPNLEPEIGQWVMAVGAPEGVEGSTSFGFVTNIITEDAMITSDAVIGRGSSGGPLVDNQGRVVGVNFAVWEEATGISLSSTIDAMCREILDC